jgi:hypothetical protein
MIFLSLYIEYLKYWTAINITQKKPHLFLSDDRTKPWQVDQCFLIDFTGNYCAVNVGVTFNLSIEPRVLAISTQRPSCLILNRKFLIQASYQTKDIWQG